MVQEKILTFGEALEKLSFYSEIGFSNITLPLCQETSSCLSEVRQAISKQFCIEPEKPQPVSPDFLVNEEVMEKLACFKNLVFSR